MNLIAALASIVLAAEPRAVKDIAYVEPKNERQTLDVYYAPDGKNRPVVFWIHGGGWQQGDKSSVQVKPQYFVDRGFVFVSTNYRYVTQVTIDVITSDVAKAIRWTHEHAREYGGDPNRLLVMGHSAGAQLAALVCTDESYLKHEGLPLAIVKACVPVDGDTYDVPLEIKMGNERRAAKGEPPPKFGHRAKFGDEAAQVKLSAVTHVAAGKNIPPFFLLHIDTNPETITQAKRLQSELQQAGIRAERFQSTGVNHVDVSYNLGKPGDEPTAALEKFLDEVLAESKR